MAVVAASIAGCAGTTDLTTAGIDLTGAGEKTRSAKATVSRGKALDGLAQAHRQAPADVPAALAYARALKVSGDRKAALAVLEAMSNVESEQGLAVERGLLALELGDLAKSRKVLAKAAGRDGKDWRIHSALGVVEASSGKSAKARGHFKQALQLAPNNPVVLNNMAVSYMLEGKAGPAEAVLRDVARSDANGIGEAKLRVERNLALASALGGKPTSLESVATAAGSEATGKSIAKN